LKRETLDLCGLARLRKNGPRKHDLAWLLQKRTTVRIRRLSEQLAMGHETRVSQSMRAAVQAEEGELLFLRQALERRLRITD
jgi:hypothetical protein